MAEEYEYTFIPAEGKRKKKKPADIVVIPPEVWIEHIGQFAGYKASGKCSLAAKYFAPLNADYLWKKFMIQEDFFAPSVTNLEEWRIASGFRVKKAFFVYTHTHRVLQNLTLGTWELKPDEAEEALYHTHVWKRNTKFDRRTLLSFLYLMGICEEQVFWLCMVRRTQIIHLFKGQYTVLYTHACFFEMIGGKVAAVSEYPVVVNLGDAIIISNRRTFRGRFDLIQSPEHLRYEVKASWSCNGECVVNSISPIDGSNMSWGDFGPYDYKFVCNKGSISGNVRVYKRGKLIHTFDGSEGTFGTEWGICLKKECKLDDDSTKLLDIKFAN